MSSIELMYLIQLRLSSEPVSGTLCIAHGTSHEAYRHFGLYKYKGLVTNPCIELTKEMILNMDKDLYIVFAEYNRVYKPKFSYMELKYLVPQLRKCGYKPTCYDQRLSLSR
jgi:hypothetical protein